jgi:hypothetical protein
VVADNPPPAVVAPAPAETGSTTTP